MVKEAEANAGEDKKRKDAVEAKNQAESLIHSTQKTLKEAEGKVPEADKSAIEAAIADLKVSIEAGDADDIQAKQTALMQLSMKMGEALYKAGGAASPTGAADNDHDENDDKVERDEMDDILDAEFTEVDDQKKK